MQTVSSNCILVLGISIGLELLHFATLVSDAVEREATEPPAPTAHCCLSNEVTYPSWLQSRNKINYCQHHNENERGSQAQVTDVMSLSIQHPPGPIVALRLQPHSVTRTVLYPPALQPITHCYTVIACERKFECKVTFLFTCCSIFRSCCLTLECTVLRRSAGTLTCKTIRGFSWLCTLNLISNFNSHMLL